MPPERATAAACAHGRLASEVGLLRPVRCGAPRRKSVTGFCYRSPCCSRADGLGRGSLSMRGIRLRGLRALAVSAGIAMAAATAPATAAPKHLLMIMMENHSTEDILGNADDAPYLNQLIKQAGVRYATQYFGVTH